MVLTVQELLSVVFTDLFCEDFSLVDIVVQSMAICYQLVLRYSLSHVHGSVVAISLFNGSFTGR